MKYALVAALGIVATAFLAAGAGTPWATFEKTDSTTGVTHYQKATWSGIVNCPSADVCTTTSFYQTNIQQRDGCKKLVSFSMAAGAFSIFAAFLGGCGIIPALAGASIRSKALDLPRFASGVFIGVWLMSLLGWAFAIALWTTDDLCDSSTKALKDEATWKMGPSVALQVIGWIILSIAIAAGYALPADPAKDE